MAIKLLYSYAQFTSGGFPNNTAPVNLEINSDPSVPIANRSSVGNYKLEIIGITNSYYSTYTGNSGIGNLLSYFTNGVPAGTYTLRATNTNTLETDSVIITINLCANPFIVSISESPKDCFSFDTIGTALISVSGGCNRDFIGYPYGYDWTWTNTSLSVNVSGSGNPYAIPYSGGTLTLPITKNEIHTLTLWIPITTNTGTTGRYSVVSTYQKAFDTSPISDIIVQTTNIICNLPGTIDITPIGGTAPYSYLTTKSGVTVSTAKTFSVYTAGSYLIEVTDTNGCKATKTVTISRNDSTISVSVETNTGSCNTVDCDGEIILSSITGGTSPYSVTWTGPNGYTASSTTLELLCSGSYTYTVVDANGCTKVDTIIIDTGEDVFDVLPEGTEVSCYGANDGSVITDICEGSPDCTLIFSYGSYTFHWIGPDGFTSSSRNISGLKPGLYTITVTSTSNCVVSKQVIITEPSPIDITLTVINPQDCSSNDGKITTAVTGGTLPYTYLWSNTATTANISSLDSGTYTLHVLDDNGCTSVAKATLVCYTDIEKIILRTKCCAADIAYQYVKAESLGRDTVACLESKLLYLNSIICLLEALNAGETCVSLDSLPFIMEQINKICGCCDCDFDKNMFNDTL